MQNKSLIKDYKMLVVEEYFNDEIEDLLWRLRQIDRKPIEEIAKHLSKAGVSIAYEEVASWLSYLDADTLIPKELIKPKANKAPPPSPKKKNASSGLYDPKTASLLCNDKCPSAASCKFYARYYGKRCPVDSQAKQDFLEPLKSFLTREYSRDEDLQKIFKNIADQAATVHQLMQRKIRHMNTQGITVIERKTDPSTGKLVENEIPNPLNASILADSKQLTSLLKEMGLTPKSLVTKNDGDTDPASLSKAMEVAKRKQLDNKHLEDIKKDRYKNRPEINSKEQLLALIEEKKGFNRALEEILEGDFDIKESQDTKENQNQSASSFVDSESVQVNVNKDKNSEIQDKNSNIKVFLDGIDNGKIIDNENIDEIVDSNKKVLANKHQSFDVELPDDLQEIIDSIEKKEKK